MIKQKSQGGNVSSSEGLTLATVLKGIILSYIITIPTFVIFSIILTYVNFPERLINPVVVITTIISILVAGISVTKNAKNRGWLNGGFVGLIYMLILYILSSIVFDNFKIDRYVVTMVVIGVLTGCIGGILGINMRSSTHSKVKHRRIHK